MNVPHRAVVIIAAGVIGGSVGVTTLGLWALPLAFSSRVLPGVSVAGVSLGGRAAGEVHAALASRLRPAAFRIRFVRVGEVSDMVTADRARSVEPTAAEIGAQPDLEQLVARALAAGRDRGLRGLASRLFLLLGRDVPVPWRVPHDTLAAYLRAQFPEAFQDPKEPSWALEPDGTFVFQPGESGLEIPVGEVVARVQERLEGRSGSPISLRTVVRPAATVDADARVAGVAATQLLSQSLVLVAEDQKLTVPPEVIASWVQESPANAAPQIDQRVIEQYLRASVAPAIARAPADAQFEVSVVRATRFVPPAPGVELRVPESVAGILQGLAAGAESVKLVTKPVPPAVTETPLMSQYGIRALIARGESDFSGSPRNRQHNIRVGAEKYHGLLIPPSAEFSFNQNLGPVDAANGFLPELVILSNVTTPMYGGGLCQVSTTMFRSLIRAGLPIVERYNHAYAVSYYGIPGFDATIWPGSKDVKAVNDTPGHILVQAKLEGTKLAFEFWGTSDGRQVEVLGPFPYGRQSNGAVKATLVRKITKAGQTSRDEWQSNYKSPKLFPKVLAANAERETWEERVRRIAERDRLAQEGFDRKKAEFLQKQPGTMHKERGTRRPPPKPTSALPEGE